MMKVTNMANLPNADLLAATGLLKAGRLTEATAALQRMLGGRPAASPATPEVSAPHPMPPTLEGVAEPIAAVQSGPVPPSMRMRQGAGQVPFGLGAGARATWPDALRGLLDRAARDGGPQRDHGGRAGLTPARAPEPEGAQFLAASFSNEAGSRPYKLYVPSRYRPGCAVPLIVMLHGCTQSPDDFAAGTRMNEAAEEHTCLVVYPGQTSAANMQKCWNWFSASDQQRGQGEPSLIAGIAHQVMRDYAIDSQRVYVAGLSAGGAAAAIMGDAYPDLFAAIGVHSGLACGAARDMPSAFAAMQGNGAAARSGTRQGGMPAIVFHGDRDSTVNSRNADAVVAQAAPPGTLSQRTDRGHSAGGHAYSRTVSMDAAGATVIEQWKVHGAGHAWFGGSAAGSYTDPRGPDATREMLRFFLEHPHSGRTRTA